MENEVRDTKRHLAKVKEEQKELLLVKKLEQEQREELTGELEFKDQIHVMESEYTQLKNELKSMKKRVAEAKSNQLVRHNLAIDNAQ